MNKNPCNLCHRLICPETKNLPCQSKLWLTMSKGGQNIPNNLINRPATPKGSSKNNG
jgi:hypothetical protein